MTREGKAVGIDIGGTKIAVATVTAGAGVVREATIPTDSAEAACTVMSAQRGA
jgi:predicted NBD/HSP70 family sugar kinase